MPIVRRGSRQNTSVDPLANLRSTAAARAAQNSANRAQAEAAARVNEEERMRQAAIDAARSQYGASQRYYQGIVEGNQERAAEGLNMFEAAALRAVGTVSGALRGLGTGVQNTYDAERGAEIILTLQDDAARTTNRILDFTSHIPVIGGVVSTARDTMRYADSIGAILFPKPDMIDTTGIGENFYEGARSWTNSRVMSVPGMVGGAVLGGGLPGLIVGGAIGGGTVAGLAEISRSYDEALARGMNRDDARWYAIERGAYEAGTEGVSNIVEMLPFGRIATGPAKATMRSLLSTSASSVIKQYALNYSAEMGTEVLNFGLQNWTNTRYNMPSVTPFSSEWWENVGTIMQQTAITSALFAGEAHLSQVYANTQVRNALETPEPANLASARSEAVKADRLVAARQAYKEFLKVDPIQAQSWMMYAITKIDAGESVNIDLRNKELSRVVDTHRIDAATLLGSTKEELYSSWNGLYRDLGATRDLTEDELNGFIDVAVNNGRNLQAAAMAVVEKANQDTNGSLNEYIEAGRAVREFMLNRKQKLDEAKGKKPKDVGFVSKSPYYVWSDNEVLKKTIGQMESVSDFNMSVAFKSFEEFMAAPPMVATIDITQTIGQGDEQRTRSESIFVKLGKDGKYRGVYQYPAGKAIRTADGEIAVLSNRQLELTPEDVYLNNVAAANRAGIVTKSKLGQVLNLFKQQGIDYTDPVEYLGLRTVDGMYDAMVEEAQAINDGVPEGVDGTTRPVEKGARRMIAHGKNIIEAQENMRRGLAAEYTGSFSDVPDGNSAIIFDQKTIDDVTSISVVARVDSVLSDAKRRRMNTVVQVKDDGSDVVFKHNPQASTANEKMVRDENSPIIETPEYRISIDDIFGAFQGNKRKVVGKVIASLIENVSPVRLAGISKIVDYFSGSGNYALTMAIMKANGAYVIGKTDNDGQHTLEVKINDFTGFGRMKKIQPIHEASERDIRQLLYEKKYGDMTFTEAIAEIWQYQNEARKTSRSVLAGRLGSIVSGNGPAFRAFTAEINQNELFAAIVQTLIDATDSSHGPEKQGGVAITNFKQAAVKTVGKLENGLLSMNRLAAYARNSGIRITYADTDAYSGQLDEGGANVLSVVDPPYYASSGYTDDEKMVGLGTYMNTSKLLSRLRSKGGNIIYNDSDWFNYSEDEKNKKAPDRMNTVDGRNAYDILKLIDNTMDMFGHFVDIVNGKQVRHTWGGGRAKGRGEVLGLYFGGQINGNLQNSTRQDFVAAGVSTVNSRQSELPRSDGRGTPDVAITDRGMVGRSAPEVGGEVADAVADQRVGAGGRTFDAGRIVARLIKQPNVELFTKNSTRLIDAITGIFVKESDQYPLSRITSIIDDDMKLAVDEHEIKLGKVVMPNKVTLYLKGRLFAFTLNEVTRDGKRIGLVYRSQIVDGEMLTFTPSQLKKAMVEMAVEHGLEKEIDMEISMPEEPEIVSKYGQKKRFADDYVKRRIENFNAEYGPSAKVLYSKEMANTWRLDAEKMWDAAVFAYNAEVNLTKDLIGHSNTMAKYHADTIAEILSKSQRIMELVARIKESIARGEELEQMERDIMEAFELMSRPYPIEGIIEEIPEEELDITSVNGMSFDSVRENGSTMAKPIPLLTVGKDHKNLPDVLKKLTATAKDERPYSPYNWTPAYPMLTGKQDHVLFLPLNTPEQRDAYYEKVVPELLKEGKARGLLVPDYQLTDYFPEIMDPVVQRSLFGSWANAGWSRSFLADEGRAFVQDEGGSAKISDFKKVIRALNYIDLIHNVIDRTGQKGDEAAAMTYEEICYAIARRHERDEEIRRLHGALKTTKAKKQIGELLVLLDRVVVDMNEAQRLFSKGLTTFNDLKSLLPPDVQRKAQALYDEIAKDDSDKKIVDVVIPRLREVIRDAIIYELANRHTGIGLNKKGNVYVTLDQNGAIVNTYTPAQKNVAVKRGIVAESDLHERFEYEIKRKGIDGRINKTTIVVSNTAEAMKQLGEQQQMLNELLPYTFWMPHVRKGSHWVIVYGRDKNGELNEKVRLYAARADEADAKAQAEVLEKEIAASNDPLLRGAAVKVVEHNVHTQYRHTMNVSELVMMLKDAGLMYNPDGTTHEVADRLLKQYKAMSPLLSKLIRSRNLPGYVGNVKGKEVSAEDYTDIAEAYVELAYSASAKMFRNNIIDTKVTAQDIGDNMVRSEAIIYLDNMSKPALMEKFDSTMRALKIITYFSELSNKFNFIVQNILEPIWAVWNIDWQNVKNKRQLAVDIFKTLIPKTMGEEYNEQRKEAIKRGVIRNIYTESILSYRNKHHPRLRLNGIDLQEFLVRLFEDIATQLSFVSNASDHISSSIIFSMGLMVAKNKGLSGDAAYGEAIKFLYGRGKPLYNDANVPMWLNRSDSNVVNKFAFQFLKYSMDWLGKLVFGPWWRKLMYMLTWGLMAGPGTLPIIGRSLAKAMGYDDRKSLNSLNIYDRWLIGGLFGIIGGSSRFFLPLSWTNDIQNIIDPDFQSIQQANRAIDYSVFPQLQIAFRRMQIAAKFGRDYSRATGIDKETLTLMRAIPMAGIEHVYAGSVKAEHGFMRNTSGGQRIIYRAQNEFERMWTFVGSTPLGYSEKIERERERRR